jgi:FlgN protein.
MDSVSKLKEIIELIKTKKTLLKEMKDLTDKQTDCISKEDVDDLTALIAQKEGIIKHIMEVDDSFKNTYDDLKAELGVESLDKSGILPKALLAELKEQTEEIMVLIDETIKIDEENKKNAQILKDNFAKEISKINNSKKATGAYYGKSAIFQNSYFIDSKK